MVNIIVKGGEEANFDMINTFIHNSPDFVALFNGNPFTYQQFVDMGKTLYSTLLNQKCTFLDEKYMVLDNSTVLFTANSKWLENFKDGHAVLEDPWAMQYVFKKFDNAWKIISFNESGVERIVKASDTPKELNQVELFKQMLGTWKAEIARDTFYIAQYKPFGDGVEGAIKIVSKGKKIMEGKVLLGYDKKNDKFVETDLVEGSDIMLYGIWFTSKSTLTEVPWEDILNPEKSPVIWKYEIKSPDLFVWNNIENNKTTFSYNFHREK